VRNRHTSFPFLDERRLCVDMLYPTTLWIWCVYVVAGGFLANANFYTWFVCPWGTSTAERWPPRCEASTKVPSLLATAALPLPKCLPIQPWPTPKSPILYKMKRCTCRGALQSNHGPFIRKSSRFVSTAEGKQSNPSNDSGAARPRWSSASLSSSAIFATLHDVPSPRAPSIAFSRVLNLYWLFLFISEMQYEKSSYHI
jgi:hypothetical protein